MKNFIKVEAQDSTFAINVNAIVSIETSQVADNPYLSRVNLVNGRSLLVKEDPEKLLFRCNS